MRDRFHPLALALLALVCAAQAPAAGAVREDDGGGRIHEALTGPRAWLPNRSVQQATVGSLAQSRTGERLRLAPRAEETVQAAIRGSAVRATALAEEAGARQAGLARIGGALLVGAPLEPSASTPAIARIRAAPRNWQPPRAWSKGRLAGASAHRSGRPRAPSLDFSMLDSGRMAAPPARVAPARVYRPEPPVMPLPGEIVRAFDENAGRTPRPGFVIAATPGQAVAAPEDGRIVFAGPFKSYGLLLIIEHSREYHTLLWGFSRIDVAYGEDVRTGQVVGAIGTDAGDTPELHVELRRNGRPVNPMPWLAASTSRIRG
jgi:murein DD-endopeptidase MepM/ murein hydrolase activator NlpD